MKSSGILLLQIPYVMNRDAAYPNGFRLVLFFCFGTLGGYANLRKLELHVGFLGPVTINIEIHLDDHHFVFRGVHGKKDIGELLKT